MAEDFVDEWPTVTRCTDDIIEFFRMPSVVTQGTTILPQIY